jgi:hypothetical protein
LARCFFRRRRFAATVVPATQDLGNLNPPDASDFDATVFGTGTFTVEATFELTTNADTSVSATIAVNNKAMYTPGELELFKNGTALGDLVSSSPLAFFATVSPAGAWATALTEILGPGTYYVEITGTNNVAKLGVGGSVITSSVPEPSTWAMMGVGFIGLGYAAFRRRKTNVSMTAAQA